MRANGSCRRHTELDSDWCLRGRDCCVRPRILVHLRAQRPVRNGSTARFRSYRSRIVGAQPSTASRDVQHWWPGDCGDRPAVLVPRESGQVLSLRWRRRCPTLESGPEGEVLPEPLPVQGRSALSLVAGFGGPFPSFVLSPGDEYEVTVECLQQSRKGWLKLVSFPFSTLPTADLTQLQTYPVSGDDPETSRRVIEAVRPWMMTGPGRKPRRLMANVRGTCGGDTTRTNATLLPSRQLPSCVDFVPQFRRLN